MALHIRHLKKSFKGLVAVWDLSFSLGEKEILGVMGPNGAGKTTLINLITGMHKPDSGEVRFRDMDMTRLKPHQISRLGVARTFQQARVFREMTVEDNLLVASSKRQSWKRFAASTVEKRIKNIIRFLQMSVKPSVLAKDLAQDDLRRLEIARALVSDPDVLILDEPVSGLTPEECDSIISIIKELNELGISLIIVEHVMRMLMRVSDRLLVMDSGAKLCEGKPAEICRNPAVIEAYLGEGAHEYS